MWLKISYLGIWVLTLSGCKDFFRDKGKATFSVKLEHHLISKGDNRPSINLYNDSIDYFLFSLHQGLDAETFAARAGWTSAKLRRYTDSLLKIGYLHQKENGALYPACMIVTAKEGDWLFKEALEVAEEIADSAILFLPVVKEYYSLLGFSPSVSFDSLSLFLLSDVLLDNWQIDRVEREFVKSKRTARHGKNYYYQIAELTGQTGGEVFGIYGNQYDCSDTICAGVYGNNRSGISLSSFRRRNDLPLVTSFEDSLLSELALKFSKQLLLVLEKHRPAAIKLYEQSVYVNEISFAEFYMWWYHFIYTKATDLLVARDIIKLPAGGNFFYQANY